MNRKSRAAAVTPLGLGDDDEVDAAAELNSLKERYSQKFQGMFGFNERDAEALKVAAQAPGHQTSDTGVSNADSATSKLIFFESFFFDLDVDGSGFLEFEEVRRMLAFTALDISSEVREKAMQEADVHLPLGRLNRHEFMDLCITLLWDHSLKEVKMASSNYADFRAAMKRRANTRWRRRANAIDGCAGFWVPMVYLGMFLSMLTVDLQDSYAIDTRYMDAKGNYLNQTQGEMIMARTFSVNNTAYMSPESLPMQQFWFGLTLSFRFESFQIIMYIILGVAIAVWLYVRIQTRNDKLRALALAASHSTTLKDFADKSQNAGRVLQKSASMANMVGICDAGGVAGAAASATAGAAGAAGAAVRAGTEAAAPGVARVLSPRSGKKS